MASLGEKFALMLEEWEQNEEAWAYANLSQIDGYENITISGIPPPDEYDIRTILRQYGIGL